VEKGRLPRAFGSVRRGGAKRNDYEHSLLLSADICCFSIRPWPFSPVKPGRNNADMVSCVQPRANADRIERFTASGTPFRGCRSEGTGHTPLQTRSFRPAVSPPFSNDENDRRRSLLLSVAAEEKPFCFPGVLYRYRHDSCDQTATSYPTRRGFRAVTTGKSVSRP